jgi:pectinesterase
MMGVASMDSLPQLSPGSRARAVRALRRFLLGRVPRRPAGVRITRNVTFSQPTEGGPLGMDVYRPAAADEPRPVVIAVHGGGFAAGSKEWMSKVAIGLARAGFVAMAVDYRLGPRFRYPLPLDDVCAAIEFARSRGPEFGVDAGRMGLVGSSAGAMLSLLAATRGYRELRGVVSWSGIWNQAALLSDPGPNPTVLVEAGYNWIGCRVCPDIWAKVSVAANANASMPPVLLVGGTHELVPASQVSVAAEDLAELGVAHERLLVPGTAHGLGLTRHALAPTVDFLRRHVGA